MVKFIYVPEIAKLGHVALVSENLEKSIHFFKEIIGLEEVEVVDGVHYLRAWGDFEHHTLSITAGETSYVEHIAWRTNRAEDVQNFAILLKEAGIDVQTIPAGTERGQGEAIRFELPTGHPFELYYEMEKTVANEDTKSILKNQSHKAWRKGVSPRRIDHVNIATSMPANVITDFLKDKLGFKLREYLADPNDQIIGGWMSVTNLVHDIAVMGIKHVPSTAEIHHISYWLDNAQDILRAADILSEEGYSFAGPGKHGLSQAVYLYVLDPGSGLRLELFSNSYLIFEPDWKPIKWTLDDKEVAFTYWGQSAASYVGEKETIPMKKLQITV